MLLESSRSVQSSVAETISLQWEYGASVLHGATGKQRCSKVKRQGEHLSMDVTRAAWRMRRKELVLSLSGAMGSALQTSRLGSSGES